MKGAREQLFIVPVGGVNTVCTVERGKLTPAHPLPAVGHGEIATDDEAGWVAWVADQGKWVGLTHRDANEAEGRFPPLPMPEGYTAGCLALHRQVLFVGGNCGKEVLGSFDLAAREPAWSPLEVPERMRRRGKRIDDLLIDDDRLIAVDNIVYPKFLLVYDIADPRRPRLGETREIGAHEVYEHIGSGAIGENWLALLSISDGMWGGQLFVALLDRRTLAEYGWLTAPRTELRAQMTSLGEKQPVRAWHGVAWLGDVLLLAAGKDGVGMLDLGSVSRPPVPIPFDETTDSILSASPDHARFMQECEASLRYLGVPGNAGPAVRVEPVRGTRHCLAVCETASGLDTVLVTLP